MEWILLGITSLIMGRLYYWALDEGAPKFTLLSLFLIQLEVNLIITRLF